MTNRMQSLRRMAGPLCLLAWFGSTGVLRADNWPSWRGPHQNGVTTEADVPVRWSASHNIRWNVQLPGQGTSSPIVWKDQVIVTSTSGRTHTEQHVLCYRLSSGEPLWHRRLIGLETPLFTQFPPQRGHAMPSPVTDGSTLVVLFSTGDLAALDMQGRPLWFRSLQEEYGAIDNDYGLATSPVILEDMVVVQIDHSRGSYLIAIQLTSGHTMWKVPRPEIAENWTTPVAVATGEQQSVVCAGTGKLIAYELATGRQQWSVDSLARLCCPTPILVGRQLIVTSGPGGNVQGLTLSPTWGGEPQRQWLTVKGAGFVPSGICVGDRYYYASERGILTCLDVRDGQEVWSRRLEGSFRGSPVATDTHIYFTNLEGRTTVLPVAGDGKQELIRNELGEAISASPAISQGCLVFRTESRLICVAPATE